MEKPFWERTYLQDEVSTFSKGPTNDVAGNWQLFPKGGNVLDVGCGEGRNALFLAEQGYSVDAFDMSEAGISKAKRIADARSLNINFFCCDLTSFVFDRQYDVILSHGVLHLCEKIGRDRFIEQAQIHTIHGGYHVISIFTNRLPATPDNAPFTKSLFDIGELPSKYYLWELVSHLEGTFKDEHSGNIRHEHAYERIIARKP